MDIQVFVITFIIAIIFHFIIQQIFIRYKRFDDFNHRSSHKTLATRTGGIGVFATLLSVAFFFYFQKIDFFDYTLFIPLGIMFIVGVYDDFYNADFKLKFFLQIIVAKILIDQGYVISNYHGLFGLYEIPWLLAQLSTIFVFIVVVNAVNFIDGIDGLAITETIKVILLIEFFQNGSNSLSKFSILVICTLLPLYYFNFKKRQKVFLGDGGSLLLGTIISILIFKTLGNEYEFNQVLQLNKVIFCLLILVYPLVDLLRVFIIRIRNGNSPFVADNNHIHHKLNEKFGEHHIRTLLLIQVITILIFIGLSTIAR